MRPYNLRRRGEGDSSTSVFLPHLDCTPYTCLPFLPGCLSPRPSGCSCSCLQRWMVMRKTSSEIERGNERSASSLAGAAPGGEGQERWRGCSGAQAGAAASYPLPPSLRLSSSQIGAEFVQLLDQQAAEVHGWREDRGRGGRRANPAGRVGFSLHFTWPVLDGRGKGGEPLHRRRRRCCHYRPPLFSLYCCLRIQRVEDRVETVFHYLCTMGC